MPDQNKRLPGELTFTALLLLGSLFLLAQAYGISGFESITSAGMFPMLSALVMVFTAAWVVMQTTRSKPVATHDGETLPGALDILVCDRQIKPRIGKVTFLGRNTWIQNNNST